MRVVCAKPPPAKPPGTKAAKSSSRSGFAGSAEKRKPLPPLPAPRRPPPASEKGPPPAAPLPPTLQLLAPSEDALRSLPPLIEGEPLSSDALLSFERDGHLALRGLLSPAELHALAPGIHAALSEQEVEMLRTGVRCALGEAALLDDFAVPFSEASELQELLQQAGATVPFMQSFNLWRAGCASARRLACSARLVAVAASLLGCAPAQVRLYQDSCFTKRAGDGPTRWHADLAMAPLDTARFVTLWVPLQHVPSHAQGGTGLDYASGSHRDVSLHYWSLAADDLDYRYEFAEHGALELGDAAAHAGWTLHAAPPAPPGSQPRTAFTACYFVDGTRTLPAGCAGPGAMDGYDEDRESYAGWLAAVTPGAVAVHDGIPLALSVTPR